MNTSIERVKQERRNEECKAPGTGTWRLVGERPQLLVNEVADDRWNQQSVRVLPDAQRPAIEEPTDCRREEEDDFSERNDEHRSLPGLERA